MANGSQARLAAYGFGRQAANGEDRNIMDEHVQKSCWSVTAKAMIGVAGFLLLAWLIGVGGNVTAMTAG